MKEKLRKHMVAILSQNRNDFQATSINYDTYLTLEDLKTEFKLSSHNEVIKHMFKLLFIELIRE